MRMGKQEYIAYTLTGPKPSPLHPDSHTPPINTSHAHAARSIFLGSSRYSLTLTIVITQAPVSGLGDERKESEGTYRGK